MITDATGHVLEETGLAIAAGPAFLVACPVHGRMVATDTAGRLLGRCWACAVENARATRLIETGAWSTDG